MELLKYERITRHDDSPYLDRLIVFRCSWFSVLLHRFIGSDDPCPHDHPWGFISFILTCGYTEATPSDQSDASSPEVRTWYPALSVLWRPATWIHRVDIKPGSRPLTLVIHGPKSRSWGFWTRFGWLHWSKYSYHNHCE